MDRSSAAAVRNITKQARALGRRTHAHLELIDGTGARNWITLVFPEREPITRIIATIEGALTATGNPDWEYSHIIEQV